MIESNYVKCSSELFCLFVKYLSDLLYDILCLQSRYQLRHIKRAIIDHYRVSMPVKRDDADLALTILEKLAFDSPKGKLLMTVVTD